MKFRIYDASKVVPKKTGWYLAIYDSIAATTRYDASQRGWGVWSPDRKGEMFPKYWVDSPMSARDLKERVNK